MFSKKYSNLLFTLIMGFGMSLLMTLITGLFDDLIIQPERRTSKGERDIRVGLKQRDKLLIELDILRY